MPLPTLSELLYGENKPRYVDLIARRDTLTPEEAQEVLRAATHPEVKEVFEDLERQVKEGVKNPKYDPCQKGRHPWVLAADPRKYFMFEGSTKFLGHIVYEVMGKAFYGYKLNKQDSVFGRIVLEKA